MNQDGWPFRAEILQQDQNSRIPRFELYFISLYNMLEELVKSHKKMKHMLEDEASHPFSPFQVPSLSPAGKSSAGLLKGQARVDIVNMGDHPELIFCYKI